MIKEELRRSGGDVRQAADQYIDTIVTNAVLNVRGRLNVRQRDTNKAFFVVSNDPTGYLNDNVSNSSWSQQARQMSAKYTDSRRQRRCSDDDDDDNDDEDDVDDVSSISVYPFSETKDAATGLSRSASMSNSQCNESIHYCASVDEDRDTGPVQEGGGREVNDCEDRSRKCDCEQDSEKYRSRRSKDSDEDSKSCADQEKKHKAGARPCERKQKPEQATRRKLKERNPQACDTDKKQSRDRDTAKRREIVTRCDELADNVDDDVMRCLRRRDDESIESYLIRSILLLGSLANQSNSSATPATCKSRVAQAVESAVESIRQSQSPARDTCHTCTDYYSHNDNRGISYRGDREDKTTMTNWLRSPMPGRSRFTSTTGSRYSGNRSTYSYSTGGSRWGRGRGQSAVSHSSSFNSRAGEGRSPLYRDWLNAFPSYGTAHAYRTNRTERERFASRSSRCTHATGASNFNMHSNRADNAASAAGETDSPRDGAGNATELNINNSGLEQDNNSKLATTSELNGFPVADNTLSENQSNTESSTGGDVPIDSNSSSNNNRCLNNNNNNHNTSGDNCYNATTVSPAECTLVNEQHNTNNNNVAGEWLTQRRGSASRRCRIHSRGTGRSRAGRRSTAALKAVSCSAMEVDAFLHQLDAERLHPDVQLLARVLDEYRSVLGLGDDATAYSVEAWPAAWRLAQLPAGRWVVSEVLKHAQACLSNIRALKPSTFCHRRRLSVVGLALLGGVEDSVTSHLIDSVSVELEQVVLQRAIIKVVQALVNMTSRQRHHHHHHQQQQQQSVCQRCLTLKPEIIKC